jgi:hypothetical protein
VILISFRLLNTTFKLVVTKSQESIETCRKNSKTRKKLKIRLNSKSYYNHKRKNSNDSQKEKVYQKSLLIRKNKETVVLFDLNIFCDFSLFRIFRSSNIMKFLFIPSYCIIYCSITS